MTVTTGFKVVDSDSTVDVGTKFVTKEYLLDFYPDLVPAALTPRLFLWGRNDNFQIGDGTSSSRSSPVETISRGTNWKQVATGLLHMAAIKTDGTLWTCGYGFQGRLGDGTSSNRSSPVTTSGGGTTWKQAAAGSNHTSIIKTDGTLWSCGYNVLGGLGDNTSSNRSSPVTTTGGGTNWKQVACGFNHTAAVKTDGTLWTWGLGDTGQLGQGSVTSNRSSPVTTVAGGTTWKQVACGYKTTAAIKTDGTLWAWGSNARGQLGDNTSSGRSSPVTTTGGGTNWKQVASGDLFMAAVKTDGTLWTWGQNQYGMLGDGTSSSRSSPVSVTGGGTNWAKVSAGTYNTAAIKTDGTLWTWGWNTHGQLGNNTAGAGTSKSSPVNTVAGGTNWKQVSANYVMAAIAESEGW